VLTFQLLAVEGVSKKEGRKHLLEALKTVSKRWTISSMAIPAAAPATTSDNHCASKRTLVNARHSKSTVKLQDTLFAAIAPLPRVALHDRTERDCIFPMTGECHAYGIFSEPGQDAVDRIHVLKSGQKR